MPNNEEYCLHSEERYYLRCDDIHELVDKPFQLMGSSNSSLKHNVNSLMAIENFTNLLRMFKSQKLLIIGAGCSQNYNQATSNIEGLVSPLDSNFFKMAKKVLLNTTLEPNLTLQIEGIVHHLHRLYGYDPFDICDWINTPNSSRFLEILDDDRLSLEKVMTQLILENEIFQRIPPFNGYYQGNNRTINVDDSPFALIELIALTISKALQGPVCSEHIKLANSLSKGDIVISFNYDILMDNALRESKKFTDSGYLVPFQKVSDGQNWRRAEDESSDITLLKLHGSLNWLHCSNCDGTFLNRSEKISPEYSSFPKNCPSCGESNAYFQRVIVPPLLAKDYSLQPLKLLWGLANRYVARAQEIVIIGYSFPPTDFATEALLRDSLPWGRQKQTHFTIVNPDEKVYDRFKKIFNSSVLEWKSSLKEYLNSI
jgi:hypothetical protein